MRCVLITLLATGSLLFGQQTPTEPGPQAVVQQLFDAMASHNPENARDVFTPDAVLVSLRNDGRPSSMKIQQFVDLLAATKNTWLERIWSPTVLVHGPVAVVWAEYDFHLNGQFSHCGVDSVSLLKTSAGWKITSISDTRETEGCASPLGPPAKSTPPAP